MTLAFDLRVVGFCAAAALTIGLVFGLAPAWQATTISTVAAMGADTRTTTGGGGRLRHLLVAGEVAMAVLLLFGAGLLLRTLMAVESFDRGYRAESVLTMLVDPLGSSYPTPEKLQQFFDQVEAEVRTVPGVQDAAWSSALPLGDSLYGDFALTYEIVGDPPVPESQRPTTNYQVVSPTYFSTLDLPIVAGRAFDSRDTRDSPRVCIVNEAFVRTLGGRSPIGMRVSFKVADSPQDKPNVGEIVGVAKQVKGRPDEPKDFVQIYVPMAHDLIDDTLLMVRSKTGSAEALNDFVIIDFEGEPGRSVEERRRKHSPLRDVAGMIRSADYAARTALSRFAAGRTDAAALVGEVLRDWRLAVTGAFLAAYRDATRALESVPHDDGAMERLVRLFTLEKALYEVRYELDNRPDWLYVPVAALLELGGAETAATETAVAESDAAR